MPPAAARRTAVQRRLGREKILPCSLYYYSLLHGPSHVTHGIFRELGLWVLHNALCVSIVPRLVLCCAVR